MTLNPPLPPARWQADTRGSGGRSWRRAARCPGELNVQVDIEASLLVLVSLSSGVSSGEPRQLKSWALVGVAAGLGKHDGERVSGHKRWPSGFLFK